MISIIVPIYNMADSLVNCIESVLKQDYKDFELILVDDGSKDDSYNICKSYADKYDNIFTIHQNNMGSGPARNAGIQKATGDYMLFIDSDDLLHSQALSILNKRINESYSDLYVFGYSVIAANGHQTVKRYKELVQDGVSVRSDYSQYFMNMFALGIQGAPWNKLFNAKVVKQNNIEYPALKRHQDEIFISRYVNFTKDVRFIDDVLYTHYANDVKKVWNKYPANYLDIVEAVYNFRNEIIIPWNPNNETIKALIYSEYINNVIRACFRQFDKSICLSYLERKHWYKNVLFKRTEIKNCSFPKNLLGTKKIVQNKIFVFSIRHKLVHVLDILINIRIKMLNSNNR